MPHMVEGVVKEVQHWKDDKGGDIILVDEDMKLYFEGKMDIPKGPCKFEVTKGEGQHSGKFQVLYVEPLRTNPQHEMQIPPQQADPKRPEIPGKGTHVMIPKDQFARMLDVMNMKSKLIESRVKSLDFAVRIYSATMKYGDDHMLAVRKVVEMAQFLEGHLV